MGENFAKSLSLGNGDSENHERQNRNNRQTNKATETTIKTSLERYLYYIENGIPNYNIPPLSDTTLTKILQLSKNNDTEGVTSKQLENTLIEIKHEYAKAIKRSIVQYILKSPFEQKRLRIFKLPSYIIAPEYGWEHSADYRFDPPLWHESYEQSRTLLEDNLFLTAPQMGIIMKLWDEIREKYMVNLPQDDREAQSLDWRPQTMRCFKKISSEQLMISVTT